jgi:hypothetical protein
VFWCGTLDARSPRHRPASRIEKTKVNFFPHAIRKTAYEAPRTPRSLNEAGWETSGDDDAYSNACRLERRPGVRERIEYLSHQDEELIAEKRRRIEGQLWAIHEADIGAFWETYEAAKTSKDGKLATDQDGKMLTVRRQRAKLITICRRSSASRLRMSRSTGMASHSKALLKGPKRIGTCARCSISTAAKSKKRMMFPGLPMPN